jgi:hypothetical protein
VQQDIRAAGEPVTETFLECDRVQYADSSREDFGMPAEPEEVQIFKNWPKSWNSVVVLENGYTDGRELADLWRALVMAEY